jgi:hypothetical protein
VEGLGKYESDFIAQRHFCPTFKVCPALRGVLVCCMTLPYYTDVPLGFPAASAPGRPSLNTFPIATSLLSFISPSLLVSNLAIFPLAENTLFYTSCLPLSSSSRPPAPLSSVTLVSPTDHP